MIMQNRNRLVAVVVLNFALGCGGEPPLQFVGSGNSTDGGGGQTTGAGGAGGASDGGGGGTDPNCTPGETKCNGVDSKTCDADGEAWVTETCEYACSQGECVGQCVPNEYRCSDNKQEICDKLGDWQGVQTCPYLCEKGSCGGSCKPGDTTCSDLSVQACGDDAEWATVETCDYVCNGDACTGECEPGSKQCDGLATEDCGVLGNWTPTKTCPFICEAGACAGVCNPGDSKCDGLTPEICSDDGQWVAKSECSYVCSQGTCTGSCQPGNVACNGDVVQTCSPSGSWANTTTCPFVCSGGACAGVCKPNSKKCAGDVPSVCDVSGQWQVGNACPFSCKGGTCAGQCTPGDKKCVGSSTQTCNVNAVWGPSIQCPGAAQAKTTCAGQGVCGWTCQPDYANCNNNPNDGCEADLTSPSSCGFCGKVCNQNGGQESCSMGTCGITCNSNRADCNNNVNDGCETILGTLNQCLACNDSCNLNAPPNASAVCSPQGCGFDCAPMWGDCNNNLNDGCEKDVSADPWNCGGCGISCHGGTCQGGVCVEGITKVADALDVTSIALGTPYGHPDVYWAEGDGDIRKAPVGGGQGKLMASGEDDPQAVVTDGAKIIWSNTEQFSKAIRAVSVGGGNSSDLVIGHGPLELTHDGVNLFWTNQNSYEPCFCDLASQTLIWKMGLGGGVPKVVNDKLQAKAFPSWPGVGVHGNNVYRLVWKSKLAITSLRYHDKTNPVLYGTTTTGLTINGQYYPYFIGKFLTSSPGGGGVMAFYDSGQQRIVKVDLDNEIVALVASVAKVDGLAVDDKFVYAIQFLNSMSRIMKYPIGGGSPTILAANQFKPRHIRVDASHVYWVTEGYKFGNVNPGEPDTPDPVILRVLK